LPNLLPLRRSKRFLSSHRTLLSCRAPWDWNLCGDPDIAVVASSPCCHRRAGCHPVWMRCGHRARVILAPMSVGRAFGMTGEPTEVESAGVPQLSTQGRVRSWWARIRRRRVREEPTVVRAAEAFSEQAAARRPETAGCELLTGGYVTDGRTLFRVEHVHS